MLLPRPWLIGYRQRTLSTGGTAAAGAPHTHRACSGPTLPSMGLSTPVLLQIGNGGRRRKGDVGRVRAASCSIGALHLRAATHLLQQYTHCLHTALRLCCLSCHVLRDKAELDFVV